MTIVLTGATGFLGQYVLEHLTKSHHVLCVVRNKPTWYKSIPNTTWKTMSLDQLADLDEPSIQGVVHLAGMVNHTRDQDDTIYRVNLDGTLNAIHLAKKYGCRIVIASTSGVLKNTRNCNGIDSPSEKNAINLNPSWPYYNSKALAEIQGNQLYKNIIWIRPSMIFGPGKYDKPRSLDTIFKYLNGKYPFRITGGVNYVDVRDLAPLFARALQSSIPTGAYNIGGTDETVDDFFARIRTHSGVQGPRIKLPWYMVWSICRMMQLSNKYVVKTIKLPDPVKIEMASSYWSIRCYRAKRHLRFSPRSPDETIGDSVKYLSSL